MKSTDYKTEKQAHTYAQYRFDKGLSQVSQDELNLLNRWLSDLGKWRLFTDLGSGTGRVLPILLKYSPKKIIVVDQSDAMLGQLQKEFAKEIKNKQIKVVKTFSDRTSLRPNSMDVVTAFHLIKHLPEPQPTFREVARILNKDGVFIFDALNKNSLVQLNLGTCFATNENSLRKQLAQNALQIKDFTYLHPLGETIYNLPTVMLPFVKLVEKLINFILPNLGTKIFVLAAKN